MHHKLIILTSALFLEAVFGYPGWLYRYIKHPVTWMGQCLTFLDKHLNHSDKSPNVQKLLGVAAIAALLAITFAIAKAVGATHCNTLAVVVTASLLSTRSLYDHIHAVYDALTTHGLEDAREKVSRVVGRDVSAMDESGICRAAIESLVESMNDGLVAPLFWALLAGLPGLACYKAVNTADSMIGHKNERYRYFGWASARLDDIMGFIPARLSGLLIAACAASSDAIDCIVNDADKHASPNAGWPEAAMAGALGIQLGGAISYDGVAGESPVLGKGTPDITVEHLQQALRLYVRTCTILWFTLVLGLLAI